MSEITTCRKCKTDYHASDIADFMRHQTGQCVVEQLRAQVQVLEASAGQFRYLLMVARDVLQNDGQAETRERITNLLTSNDAGSAMLDRLKAAEAVCEALNYENVHHDAKLQDRWKRWRDIVFPLREESK